MALKEITDASFAVEVSGTLVLLFTSPWCTGCRKVADELEDLAQSFPQATFGKLDIGSHPQTPEIFGVLGIPTVIMFQAGREVARLGGEVREKALRKELEKLAC